MVEFLGWGSCSLPQLLLGDLRKGIRASKGTWETLSFDPQANCDHKEQGGASAAPNFKGSCAEGTGASGNLKAPEGSIWGPAQGVGDVT